MKIRIVLFAVFVSGGCGVEFEAPDEAESSLRTHSADTAVHWQLAEFEGGFDADTGEWTLEVLPNGTLSFAEPEGPDGLRTVAQPLYCNESIGAGGRAVLNTVSGSVATTVVDCIGDGDPAATALTDWESLIYASAGAFCATVQLNAPTGRTLHNTVAEIVEITPGYEGYRHISETPSRCCGNGADLDALPDGNGKPTDLAGGAFLHGTVEPGAPSRVPWIFANSGGSFTFSGRIVGAIEETANGLDDDCDGRIDEGLASLPVGAACEDGSDCASGDCDGDIGACIVADPDYGDAASETFYQGTWGGQVLLGDPDWSNRYRSLPPAGWNAYDVELMLDALEATHQNLYVVGVDLEVYDATDVDWSNAAALADGVMAREAGIDLLTCFRDDATMAEYQEAVLGTRRLRAESASVRGLTIDDTTQVFAAPWNDLNWGGLSIADVALLQAMAHDPAEVGVPVEFFPYVPGEGVPALVAPDGMLLGARACNESDSYCPQTDGSDLHGNNFYIFAGDLIEVTGQFNPGSIDPADAYQLSFLAFDQLGYVPPEAYSMEAVVEINGDEVGRYSMVDALPDVAEAYSIFEMTVTGLLPDADNTFRVFIDSGGTNITRYGDRIVYLWDGQLEAPDGSVAPLGLTDLTGRLERDASRTTYSTEPLLAGSNAPWRVSDSFDGMLFKYASREYAYDVVTHERFVASTCAPLQALGKPCIEVLWGNDQWTGDVVGTPVTSSAVAYLQAAEDHADGILVWMQPLNLYDPSQGTLASRSPATAGYQVAAGFPGQSVSIPGWYHQWTLVAPSSGTYTLRWREDGRILAEKLRHALTVDGSLLFDALNVDPSTGGTTTFEQTFDALGGQTIELRLESIAGYGYGLFFSEYDLLDPAGAAVDLTAADHTSGYSADTGFMYDCFTAYFTTHDFGPACGLP